MATHSMKTKLVRREPPKTLYKKRYVHSVLRLIKIQPTYVTNYLIK